MPPCLHLSSKTASATIRSWRNCWLVYTYLVYCVEETLTTVPRNPPIHPHRNRISSTPTPPAQGRTRCRPIARSGRLWIRQQGRSLHRRIEQPRKARRASAQHRTWSRSQRPRSAADPTLERGRCVRSPRPERSRAVEMEAVKAKGAPEVGCAGSAEH
jgi:hypothetical protein